MSRALDGVQLVVQNEMQLRAARAAGATNVRLQSDKVDRAQLASMGFDMLKCHLLRGWISTNGLSTVEELLDRHDECWGRDPSSFPLYLNPVFVWGSPIGPCRAGARFRGSR